MELSRKFQHTPQTMPYHNHTHHIIHSFHPPNPPTYRGKNARNHRVGCGNRNWNVSATEHSCRVCVPCRIAGVNTTPSPGPTVSFHWGCQTPASMGPPSNSSKFARAAVREGAAGMGCSHQS